MWGWLDELRPGIRLAAGAGGGCMTARLALAHGRVWLRMERFDADLVADIKFGVPLRRRGWDDRKRLWWVHEAEADNLLALLRWHVSEIQHVTLAEIASDIERI